VPSALETKRNYFSLSTQHFKKKHCHQLEIPTILTAFCAEEKEDGLESQGNAPDLGDSVCQRAFSVLLKNCCLYAGSKCLSENTVGHKGDAF